MFNLSSNQLSNIFASFSVINKMSELLHNFMAYFPQTVIIKYFIIGVFFHSNQKLFLRLNLMQNWIQIMDRFSE